jgi:hypothetical protein
VCGLKGRGRREGRNEGWREGERDKRDCGFSVGDTKWEKKIENLVRIS